MNNKRFIAEKIINSQEPVLRDLLYKCLVNCEYFTFNGSKLTFKFPVKVESDNA